MYKSRGKETSCCKVDVTVKGINKMDFWHLYVSGQYISNTAHGGHLAELSVKWSCINHPEFLPWRKDDNLANVLSEAFSMLLKSEVYWGWVLVGHTDIVCKRNCCLMFFHTIRVHRKRSRGGAGRRGSAELRSCSPSYSSPQPHSICPPSLSISNSWWSSN